MASDLEALFSDIGFIDWKESIMNVAVTGGGVVAGLMGFKYVHGMVASRLTSLPAVAQKAVSIGIPVVGSLALGLYVAPRMYGKGKLLVESAAGAMAGVAVGALLAYANLPNPLPMAGLGEDEPLLLQDPFAKYLSSAPTTVEEQVSGAPTTVEEQVSGMHGLAATLV